ncbi:four helix bundle protein [Devosia sp.]|uniref:four helix bundle protein n=1 Tax=Devosia sp. TaxID=1871048 RepID=UPI0035B3E756
MNLAADVYELTGSFPREEMFGMTSQMRRASVSVAANIAEGFGRQQTRSFIQFLRISQGSLKEVETLVLLAGRVGLASGEPVERLMARCQRIGKMLVGLIRKLDLKEDRR